MPKVEIGKSECACQGLGCLGRNIQYAKEYNLLKYFGIYSSGEGSTLRLACELHMQTAGIDHNVRVNDFDPSFVTPRQGCRIETQPDAKVASRCWRRSGL